MFDIAVAVRNRRLIGMEPSKSDLAAHVVGACPLEVQLAGEFVTKRRLRGSRLLNGSPSVWPIADQPRKFMELARVGLATALRASPQNE